MMRRAALCLLILSALAACTPAQRPAPVLLIEDTAERPLRQAYALKVIEFLKTDEEMSREIGEILKKELPNFLQRYAPNDKDRLNDLYGRVIIPEAQRRVQEVKQIFAGVFADLLTTDELKRMSDGFSLPAFVRFQSKQPLTEHDKQEIAALRLPELSKRLQEIKATGVELARVRCELWGKAMVEDLFRRKPDLFQERAI